MGVAVGTGRVVGVGVPVAVCPVITGGIWESFKKVDDSILLIASWFRVGVRVWETFWGTVGGGLAVRALYIFNDTQMRAVISVRTKIEMGLGNLFFFIIILKALLMSR
jgi:hypothetical protein